MSMMALVNLKPQRESEIFCQCKVNKSKTIEFIVGAQIIEKLPENHDARLAV